MAKARQPGSKPRLWRRLVGWGILGIVALIIIGALIPGGDDDGDPAPTAEAPAQPVEGEQASVDPPPDPAPEPEPAPGPPPPPRAPAPIERSGTGAQVVGVDLAADGPLVIDAEHSGGANFIVELRGEGVDDIPVNEIGSFAGSVLVEEAPSGSYRAAVTADGSWSLTFRQPIPRPGDQQLPGTLAGDGSDVVAVRATQDLELIEASNQGSANFIAEIVAIGDETTGYDILVNEIGPYQGESLTSIPPGEYLVGVTAEGPWELAISP